MTHRSAGLMLGFMLVGGGAALVPTALTVVEYPLPRPKAFPHDPAVGRDGIVWYTDQANSYIGRLDPETGSVTDYPTPTAVSGPHGIIVAPDGAVWYTANFKGRLGRLDPTTGAIKEYALPAEARDPHTPLYHNGKIWFTVQGSNLSGRLDLDGAVRDEPDRPGRPGDRRPAHFPAPRPRLPPTPSHRGRQGYRVVLGLCTRPARPARSRDGAGARVPVPRRQRQPAVRHRDRQRRAHLVR